MDPKIQFPFIKAMEIGIGCLRFKALLIANDMDHHFLAELFRRNDGAMLPSRRSLRRFNGLESVACNQSRPCPGLNTGGNRADIKKDRFCRNCHVQETMALLKPMLLAIGSPKC